MCHGRDWRLFEDRAQKKAEEKQMQERRAGVINALLGDAVKQSEETKPEPAPAKESAPAK
jgi:hypothetical protein